MIIGITGRKGHGKDTVGRILRERHGFRTLAFADPLKAAARVIFAFSDEQLNGPIQVKEAIDPRWGFSPRHALQRLGTEVGRAIHPEVWIRAAVLRLQAEPGRWAVTDVRFPNEAEALRRLGGIVVVVRRAWRTEVGNDHASEAGVDTIVADEVLPNHGTVADLEAAVARLVAAHRGQR